MAARAAPRATCRAPACIPSHAPCGLCGLRSILRARRFCVVAWSAPLYRDISGQIFFKRVERADPAALVAVAGDLIEQLLVRKREQRAVAIGLQRHRHQRFAFRRRVPRPAEHQPLVRYHLAIDAADFVVLVVGRKADTKTSTDPRVDVGAERGRLAVGAPEPSDYFLRVDPRGVDFRRRGIGTTVEAEAPAGGVRGAAW